MNYGHQYASAESRGTVTAGHPATINPDMAAPLSVPLPWTLDVGGDGDLLVTDATGAQVYAGPDHEDVMARIVDMVRFHAETLNN